jgi:energy-coupling factor transport system permease protein
VKQRAARSRRPLHPLAWWVWSAALAVCAMRTTNPFLLLLIGSVVCFVVAACRSAAPWSRSIVFFLKLGLLVIVIRVVIEILFGQRGVPGHVLFTLPRLPLPSWAVAVSIGGAVTLESMLNAAVEGMQIAVILVCFGAANSLASPYRLLRSLPAVLYETGVAVTVALSFTPELIQSIGTVRQARRLRGIPTNGLRGMRGVAVPVLESALDRSLQLATSMDARGYGRRSPRAGAARRLAMTATVSGLLLAAAGLYGVIDSGSLFGLGLPIIAVGVVVCAAGMAVGGRRTTRSRYRPDPWRQPEWVVAGCGVLALVTMAIAHAANTSGLVVTFTPLAWPSLPILPALGVVVALAPAISIPNPAVGPAGGAASPATATATTTTSTATTPSAMDVPGRPSKLEDVPT